MCLIVPFDGSSLSEAALVRTKELETVYEEEIIALAVIPVGNTEYARRRGWLDGDEEFEEELVVSRLREGVQDLTPDAKFRWIDVIRNAGPGVIASAIRREARKTDASLVVIGSDNAGRIVDRVSEVTDDSVLGAATADHDTYDVLIVGNEPKSLVS